MARTKDSVGGHGRGLTVDLWPLLRAELRWVGSMLIFLLTEETEDKKQRPGYLVSKETLGMFEFRDDSPSTIIQNQL